MPQSNRKEKFMGTVMPFDDDLPFEEKVKSLADEELLEIWAESQQMECFLNERLPAAFIPVTDYEQAIVNELFVRSGRRLVTPRPPR